MNNKISFLIKVCENIYIINGSEMELFLEAVRPKKPASDMNTKEAFHWVREIGIENFIEMVFGESETTYIPFNIFWKVQKDNERAYYEFRNYIESTREPFYESEINTQKRKLEQFLKRFETIGKDIERIKEQYSKGGIYHEAI